MVLTFRSSRPTATKFGENDATESSSDRDVPTGKAHDDDSLSSTSTTLATALLIFLVVGSSIVTSFIMVPMVWNSSFDLGHFGLGEAAVVEEATSDSPVPSQEQQKILPLRRSVDTVKLVNDKYKSGRPSDILGENGVLIHMAHVMGDNGLDAWSIAPGHATHQSCSIINTHAPNVVDNVISPVGYILEDSDTPVQCLLPEDGGTCNTKVKGSEWSGCACLGDNPYKVQQEDKHMRMWGCMWPSTSLKWMMERSTSWAQYSDKYNEVIISKRYWEEASSSGRAIMAFFYVKGSPMREEVVESYQNYLSYTNQKSFQIPLLEYDATNKEWPFKWQNE